MTMSDIDTVVKDTYSDKASEAKAMLMEFVLAINEQLELYFKEKVENVFGVSKKEKDLAREILKHVKEHNLRPCKRLRGSFIYHGYNLLGGSRKKAILGAAMSIELIHTALLMHDDFMDQDSTRRGLPTTHEYFGSVHKKNKYRGNGEHYGNSMAINAGDVALMLGFEILGETKFSHKNRVKALNRTFRGIANTAFGQAFDITLEAKGQALEKDILDLHWAKTAIYTYENPLHIGAILAGADERDLQVLSEYAVPGGIAFQLQDDILGLFGTPEETGKPNNSDLRQGKMTLLILKALEKANQQDQRTLRKIWGKHNLSNKDAEVVRKIVIKTGSLKYSEKTAVKWAKKAQLAIPKMQKMGWSKQSVGYLDGIAQYMVERKM